jgi:hypothetical protein
MKVLSSDITFRKSATEVRVREQFSSHFCFDIQKAALNVHVEHVEIQCNCSNRQVQ